MTDRSRKTQPKAAEEQTVLSEIRYLDSSTDYREWLPKELHKSNFVVLDDGRGQAWRRLRDFALIVFVVCMILLLALRT